MRCTLRIFSAEPTHITRQSRRQSRTRTRPRWASAGAGAEGHGGGGCGSQRGGKVAEQTRGGSRGRTDKEDAGPSGAPRSESTLRLDLGRGAEERGAAAAALQRLHHGYAMRTSRANRRRPRRRPPHGGGEAAAARRWRGLRRQAEADGGDGVGEGGGHGGALIAPTSLRGSGGHGRFLSAGARRR